MKFLIVCLALVAAVAADKLSPDQAVPIVRQASDINPDGTYSYSYETGNSIAAEESGTGGVQAVGSARWTAPDGTPVEFTYVADENGYQPSGNILPVAPPVPEGILRALEYIRAHPYDEEAELKKYKH